MGVWERKQEQVFVRRWKPGRKVPGLHEHPSGGYAFRQTPDGKTQLINEDHYIIYDGLKIVQVLGSEEFLNKYQRVKAEGRGGTSQPGTRAGGGEGTPKSAPQKISSKTESKPSKSPKSLKKPAKPKKKTAEKKPVKTRRAPRQPRTLKTK